MGGSWAEPSARLAARTQEGPPSQGGPSDTRSETREAYWFAGAASGGGRGRHRGRRGGHGGVGSGGGVGGGGGRGGGGGVGRGGVGRSGVRRRRCWRRCLQATTERAATAAPATRILRRASEVIVPGPLEGGCCADQQARLRVLAREARRTPSDASRCAGPDYAVMWAEGQAPSSRQRDQTSRV